MKVFKTDLENPVSELDAILAEQGAPEGRIRRMYPNEQIELIAIGSWPSQSKEKGRVSLVCKIHQWKIIGADSIQSERIMGMFNIDEKIHDSPAFDEAKKNHAIESGVAFLIKGFLSDAGNMVLVESVRFVSLDDYPEFTTNVHPIEHSRFGKFVFSSTSQSYVCNFQHNDQFTTLELVTKEENFNDEVEKVGIAYNEIGQIIDWLATQKRAQHDSDKIELGLLKLDRDLFSCTFKYHGHPKIEFVNVYVTLKDGSLADANIMDISKYSR